MLFFQEITACIEHDLQWYHTHQFRTGNPNSTNSRPFASQFKDLMQRYCCGIGNVEGKLRDAVFLNIPANAFHSFQHSGGVNRVSAGIFYYFSGQRISFPFDATFFTYIEGNTIGPTGGGGVEVYVVSNQQISCTESYGTGSPYCFIKFSWAKIGFPFRICKFLRQSLVFTGTTSCQVAAFFFRAGKFVEIPRDAKFIADAFPEFSGVFYCFIHCDIFYRNKRQHIRCPKTGMFTVMFAHVNQFRCFFHRPECRFAYCIWFANKSYHGAVRSLSGININ